MLKVTFFSAAKISGAFAPVKLIFFKLNRQKLYLQTFFRAITGSTADQSPGKDQG